MPDKADDIQRLVERIEGLENALGHFVNIRDQFPESIKLIEKSLDSFTPVTVTVTKAQFLEAFNALRARITERTDDE